MQPKISIIVRTLNEDRHLANSLRSIKQQRYNGDIEIIVVDSGSTDDTLNIAEKYGATICHIKKQNFTYGRALNIGLSAASGQIGVILSAHCIPEGEYWLKNLLKPIVTGVCVYSYSRQVGEAQITKYSENQVFHKYYPKKPLDRFTPEIPNNAAAAILISVWEQYKFDESVPGLEDMYMYKILKKHGHISCYCPSSVVQHIHDESWRHIFKRYNREAVAYRTIYPEKPISLITILYFGFLSIVFDTYTYWKKIKGIKVPVYYRSAQFCGIAFAYKSYFGKSHFDTIKYYYPIF